MARIAFAGLGNMGLGMATRLLGAGHQLNLYNRTAARAASLVEQGATLYDTPRRACELATRRCRDTIYGNALREP